MIGIKDMEMPSYCLWDCPLAREDGGACQLADVRTSETERPKDCPLVEIGTCKDCRAWRPRGDENGFCARSPHGCKADESCENFEKRGAENE